MPIPSNLYLHLAGLPMLSFVLNKRLVPFMGVLSIVFCTASWSQPQEEKLFENAPKDDKGRYTNRAEKLDSGKKSVRIGFFLRRVTSGLRGDSGKPNQLQNDGSFLRSNRDNPTITWIGHATFLVQMQGVNFLTDPMWSKTASPIPPLGPRRMVKPGIALEDLPVIDFVVISHNHYDHLDIPTLRKLAKINPDTVFYVPMDNGKLLRKKGLSKVQEMDWGDSATYGDITIYCTPAQHWSKRTLTDTRKTLWSSWAFISPVKRFYFAGDTGYFRGFKEIGEKLGPFDLAAMPIGAYEPNAMMRSSHMNPEEAVKATLDVQAKSAVAMHYGTFNLSDEPIAEPPLRFRQAAADSELGEANSWVLAIGETREF